MRKIVLMIMLLSVMSFAGSFKLGNTYFHEDGTHHFDNSKVFGRNANKFAMKQVMKAYRDKNNLAAMELRKAKKMLLLSANNNIK